MESDYCYRRNAVMRFIGRVFADGKGQSMVLYMALLPLIDGFFIANLGKGGFSGIGSSVSFGLVAFSGPACMVSAANLKGSALQRTVGVSCSYALIAAIAICVAGLESGLHGVIPEGMGLLTAVMIAFIGFLVSGQKYLVRCALLFGGDKLSRVILLYVVLCAFTVRDVSWAWSLNGATVAHVLVAVFTGFCLTMGGVLLGLAFDSIDGFREQGFRYGGGAALIMMAGCMAGAPIPQWAILGVIGMGLAWGFSGLIRRSGAACGMVDMIDLPEGRSNA